jgi:PPOX class probable FMN-dependent enzyme
MDSATGYPPLLEILSTEEEIETAVGRPAPRIMAKVVDSLDDICRAFISRSPFIVVGSSDSHGHFDLSPKGDLPGFVQVLDDRTIAIPERPGNRRADTFRNVLQNPRVGLIFIVPGKGETLRVSGAARVVRDVWLRERMAVDGRVPELALVVTVEEAFIHCTKCMVRSRMWQPDSWNAAKLATNVEALIVHSRLDMSVAELQALYENDVRTRLY